MHVIPDLKRLESKYRDVLVVIGVHSAKFTFEGTDEGIRDAVLRNGLEHPVINDRKMEVWKSFGVRAWPTLVLIDPEGTIIWKESGEVPFETLDTIVGTLTEKLEKKLDKTPLKLSLERDKRKPTELLFPAKILAADGKLFVADTGNHRILILSAEGKILGQIGSGKEGREDGAFDRASFSHPRGLAWRANTLFVADTDNHQIRAADLDQKKVITIAGTGQKGYSRGGKALETELASPWDLAIDGEKLYVAMAGRHQIWVYESPEIRPFAGSGRENIMDGPVDRAALSQPSGLWLEGRTLYFADAEDSAIRLVDLDKSAVRTLAGTGLFDFGDKDGTGNEVLLQHPLAVLFHDGTLYVADAYNHKIKACDPHTRAVRTVSGSGKPGMKDGSEAQFNEPTGLAWLGGNLYIADTNNHAIRVLDPKSRKVATLILTR